LSFFEQRKSIFGFGNASNLSIFLIVKVMRDFKLIFSRWLSGPALGVLFFAAGCKREQVASYQVPKEDHSVKPLSMPGMGPAMAGGMGVEESAPPELKWTLPSGWSENTGQQKMGVGSFHVDGGDGKSAEVRVIPLKAGSDIEQRSVNMWRQELGLAELPVDQVQGQDVTVAGTKGHLYDLKSEKPRFGGKFKARTTAAVVEKAGMLWFIKMAGEESVVTSQQDNFKNFLQSMRFEPGAMPAGHPQVAGASGENFSGGPNWKIPATWKQMQPGQMVIASYRASKDGATADVSVSSFDGPTGGLLANVNRWRGQVGLAPIDENDLATQVKTVDLSDGSKGSVVDVTGTSPRTGKAARLYGLIVSRGQQMWFYKILGDSNVIESEKANLVEFAGIAH
jgi:hypothetical protein